MDQALKRSLFPLRAPRALTLAWWPAHVFAASVEAYHTTFFAVIRDV